MAGETEGERFADFPRVSFGIVGLHDVGDQTINETANHVDLASQTRRTAVEVRVLREERDLRIKKKSQIMWILSFYFLNSASTCTPITRAINIVDTDL